AAHARYVNDPIFAKVLAHPNDHKLFAVHDELIWHKTTSQMEVLCIPHVKVDDQSLTEIIIDEGHTVTVLNARHTGDYVHHWYWWPDIGKEIA
ncbi:uncharacterized protein LAESUDRAFT_654337, partial [Laetiporus sulphureus 93-53]